MRCVSRFLDFAVVVFVAAMMLAVFSVSPAVCGSVPQDRRADTEESYDGTTAVDPDNVWSVGTDGTIVYYDGETWTEQQSGTSEDLTAVDAVDEGNVWAVGTDGTILHFDGTDWSPEESGTTNVLTGVSALDTSHVWVSGTAGTILFYDGTTWQEQNSGTVKDLYCIFALDETHVWAVGADGTILFFDGSTWTAQASGTSGDLFGVSAVDASHAWAVGEGGVILFFDGSGWTEQESGTAKDLYAVTAIDTNDVWASGADGTLLHFDGEEWSPQESGTDENLYDITPVDEDEVIAVGDEETVVVLEDPQPDTWYLAEGSTAWGYSTTIAIENPNEQEVTVRLTYMITGAGVQAQQLTAPGRSQLLVNPSELIGSCDFSTKVECLEGKAIAVDRTMTWPQKGTGAADAPSGSGVSGDGHCSVGVTSPARTWYLPEGSSAWGFECWLLIQNPNDTVANCEVTYMIEGEGPRTVTHVVPPNSRESYSMEEDIGNKDASIKVDSDVEVIPERAMYRPRDVRTMGHDSIGTTRTATDYYLAEGTVGYGFTTYVLIQNPQDTPTDVTVTYMTGAGPETIPTFQMNPNSRRTINVNETAQLPDPDFSTRVSGSQPIIAERAMYWGEGTEAGGACHDSIGMNAPHTTFYLPYGGTWEAGGLETWTLVQNPNDNPVDIEITYFSGVNTQTFTDTIGANSRQTYDMRDKIINTGASIMVTSLTAGSKIMVERAMYWNDRGSGTDTIGGYTD